MIAGPSYSSADLVVRGRRVVTPEATRAAAVHVAQGVIVEVAGHDDVPPGAMVVDVGDAVLLPGLVDTHVHVSRLGQTDGDGFDTATRAAAAGGVTTLIDMPVNAVTTSAAALGLKRLAAQGRCWVDVGFAGGLVPANARDVGALRALHDAGIYGFTCSLAESGVDEFAPVTERDLAAAMPVLRDMGALLVARAELAGPIDTATAAVLTEERYDPRRYANYMRSRPREAESEGVDLLVRLAADLGARVHIAHLSSSDIFPVLSEARERGVRVSAETCPHYLHFTAEEVPDGATQYKCAPPIRDRAQRESLWEALEEGLIEVVASDHSPGGADPQSQANGDFLRARVGIASLQLGLSVMWRQAHDRGHAVARLVEWMSSAPARLLGLGHRKGAIAAGHDADLVVWDPEAEYVVDPSKLFGEAALTPYAGSRLPGVVRATYVRGERVYEGGTFAPAPAGRLLAREDRRASRTPR